MGRAISARTAGGPAGVVRALPISSSGRLARSQAWLLVTYMAEANVPDDLATLIRWGREERNLEFKRSMSWTDPATKEKLTKSALAMANLRGGGYIVFGVERQPGDTYVPVGMPPDHLDSFVQDNLSAHFSEYADPYIEASLIKETLNGSKFAVVKVAEFSELPVICKKDCSKLRHGAVYIRSRRIPETVEVPTQVEMREILDLAIEKRYRAFSRQAERLGLVHPSQRDEFLDQLKALPEAQILSKIRSMGRWRVWIRPTVFAKARFQSLAACREFVLLHAVSNAGWQYPLVGNGGGIEEGDEWIARDVEPRQFLIPAPHLERWALFRSGQFVHNFAFPEEFIGREEWPTHPQLFIPGPNARYLNILEALKTVSRVFEFAARMAYREVLSPACAITIELYGVDGRELSYMYPTPKLEAKYWCRTETIQVERLLDLEELKSKAGELALEATLEIFKKFDWSNPPKALLAEQQARLLG
jgi:hypothetical protein